MAGGGHLCYTKSGSTKSLVYSKRSGDTGKLVYKGGASDDKALTVRIPWGPQSYTCDTYHCYHRITFRYSVSFETGDGDYSAQDSGSESVLTFRLDVVPATIAISLSCTTPCSDPDEDPGVKARIVATARGKGVVFKEQVSAPRASSPSVSRIYVNDKGKPTSIT